MVFCVVVSCISASCARSKEARKKLENKVRFIFVLCCEIRVEL